MAKPKRKPAAGLSIRLLGEMELWRGAQRLALPQSKKTRALLAYLVVTEKPQRRDRLCDLLWDVADDPRAALRWSLSKLRPLVDEPDAPRLVGERETIGVALAGAAVDLFALRESLAGTADPPPLARLLELAEIVRGPFLEGLELPDFLAFQSWCLGVREEARRLHARLLGLLVERLADAPERALPFARSLAQLDPLDEAAQVTLVRLLAACERGREAEQHVHAAMRLLGELGAGDGALLRQAWGEIGVPRTAAAPAAGAPAVPDRLPRPPALVGREEELARLHALLDAVSARRGLAAVLLSGEAGIGKTSLLGALAGAVAARGGTVLDGAAYEAESGRPYGPWLDALRRLPATAIGPTLGRDLAPLLPELGAGAATAAPSRDRLFGAVVELLAARAHSAPPVLLAFDDVQWCDEASAELLHYAARMSRHRPVLLALAARAGELDDNPAIARLLRGLRHDAGLEELDVGPLSPAATAALVGGAAAADAQRVFAESAGNPLFALEVARSLPHRQAGLPSTLRRLVRDRIERLPADAVELLRWSAVIGRPIDVAWLGAVAELDAPRLVLALEGLERHALLRPRGDEPGSVVGYEFAHDVVRQAVYGELSEPRRRLMHLRLARALPRLGATDDDLAADLAQHAALGGDLATAAHAGLRAAQRGLRLFAAGAAAAL
ncbi:MAG: AAA family ATPase, partial [Deltaproteobacteria bacterium]|nr:AAA family ATPase [Deltaproteobacteria bacterium]